MPVDPAMAAELYDDYNPGPQPLENECDSTTGVNYWRALDGWRWSEFCPYGRTSTPFATLSEAKEDAKAHNARG